MAAGPDMKVNIGGIELQNPVMTASGTFGYAREFDHLLDLNRLGGIIVKGLSLLPTKGNPPPRIVETACGMINAIGLENVGIERFITEKLPFLQRLSPPVFVNIYGKLEAEYRQLAARINAVEAIAGIEVNISCPNVKAGGMAFGVDPQAAFQVIRAVREQTAKPVMVKLSPNVTDITEIATAVEEAGADSISLINTLSAMAIDINTRKAKIANIIGGLSGPAIKPIALRMVWQVAQKATIPIIGIGGIMTFEDALEFLIAGATAVQVGTANIAHQILVLNFQITRTKLQINLNNQISMTKTFGNWNFGHCYLFGICILLFGACVTPLFLNAYKS
ncbi:MAG: dihydroorotate dehydrogenase [Desulfobacterales bacterium]